LIVLVTLEEVHAYGAELERWLRMRVHPIAVKMLKGREDVPEGAVIPTRDWGHKFSLCQAFAKAQRDGLTVAMFKGDMWCFEPVVGLGLVESIPYFLEGNHRYPDSVRTLEDAGEWCRNMPHLEHGKYQGIVVGPVNTCSFMPEVVTMHVNGMQMSQLLIVKNWIDGRDVHAQLSGHAVCNYAVVPPLLSGECTVAIPCKGDRRLAMAQDDEIMFSLSGNAPRIRGGQQVPAGAQLGDSDDPGVQGGVRPEAGLRRARGDARHGPQEVAATGPEVPEILRRCRIRISILHQSIQRRGAWTPRREFDSTRASKSVQDGSR
jgi:uncharacterized protein (DUF169 family)